MVVAEPFDTVEDVVRRGNNSVYGLAAVRVLVPACLSPAPPSPWLLAGMRVSIPLLVVLCGVVHALCLLPSFFLYHLIDSCR